MCVGLGFALITCMTKIERRGDKILSNPTKRRSLKNPISAWVSYTTEADEIVAFEIKGISFGARARLMENSKRGDNVCPHTVSAFPPFVAMNIRIVNLPADQR